MAEIQLTKGKCAVVDATDYDWLNQWKWYAQHTGVGRHYAMRRIERNGISRLICMHRFILEAPEGVEVDHKNGNPLDNQRENLRLCNRSQNSANSRKQKRSISKYKGVTLHQGKWRARIRPNGQQIELGCFSTQEEAGEAYDVAAIKHFGEFARLNILSRVEV